MSWKNQPTPGVSPDVLARLSGVVKACKRTEICTVRLLHMHGARKAQIHTTVGHVSTASVHTWIEEHRHVPCADQTWRKAWTRRVTVSEKQF